MNCLILDDEPFATDLIEAYVNQTDSLNLVHSLNNPLEALSILESEDIDLLFLDIQMPHLTGFDLLAKLKKKPLVILISAHPEYALIGFQWDVVDYLLKPVRYEDFERAVSKALTRNEGNRPSQTITATNSFFVRGEHKIMKVDVESILFIES
ncbi:MAG: LytR/AlgR family response regulator transcription factor, partial [Crocinitomicaceae bacterium]